MKIGALVRSIKEICAPYYQNDEDVIAEWLQNKTPENVQQWIEFKESFCVVAVDSGGQIVGFACIRGCEILLNYVVPEALTKESGSECCTL